MAKRLAVRTLCLGMCFGLALPLFAQKTIIERIDPPHWWVNFEYSDVELLIKGKNLPAKVEVRGEGVSIVEVIQPENKNYLRLVLRIAQVAKPQKIQILMGKTQVYYELKSRNYGNKTLMGLHPNDFIYLITPDRFANGNPANDVVKGMAEDSINRKQPYARHGGDIAGIASKLDYIEDLGVTALWINPLLENNQPQASYHGYAITDHYKTDPRFGTNEDFKALVNNMHSRGMKMVMDVIYNHWGDRHYLHQDLPDYNMVNWWNEFTKTNYRSSVLHDPYASPREKTQFTDGWFDHHMPDLNQRNPLVANYLIQNSIWWIEEFGIDAFRIDTYTYPDQEFMSELARRILKEYPNFFMFGETWVHVIQEQNFFLGNNKNRLPFNSNLQSVTDFQWYFALEKGILEPTDWASGMSRMYYVLSGDYLYTKPQYLVTFLDNHDLARWYGHVGEDMNKFKIGIALLFTSRGIPQLYYGTEILMKETNGHGEIREDFPGGWPSDKLDKFQANGRTEVENEAFNYIKKLANYRQQSAALTTGELTQFTPKNGLYIFLRHAKNGEKVLVVVNNADVPVMLDDSLANEWMPAGTLVRNIENEAVIEISQINMVEPGVAIFEVVR